MFAAREIQDSNHTTLMKPRRVNVNGTTMSSNVFTEAQSVLPSSEDDDDDDDDEDEAAAAFGTSPRGSGGDNVKTSMDV